MTMVKLVAGLGVAALAIRMITHAVTPRFGAFVDARSLEVPAKYQAYTAKFLGEWIAAWPREARAYAVPVLFPLDLLFMICLAAALALAAVGLAERTAFAPVAWTFVILPALYLAADLAEDTVLAQLLLRPSSITTELVGVAKALTGAKLATLVMSTGQVVLLGILFVKGLLRP